MEYTIKTPENHPSADELKEVANKLLAFLPLHSIYFSVNNVDLNQRTIITLFLSKECQLDSDDVVPFIEKVFKSYPLFSFVFFEKWWATKLWKMGSPFLMLHATRNELAYAAVPENKIFRLDSPKIKKLVRKFKQDYQLRNAKAESFIKNVTFYSRYGNYKQAAFHLHQALQQKFETLSWLTKGDYQVSDKLIWLQSNMIDLLPAFGNLFDPKIAEEAAAIEELDNSYRAVLHNEKYKFTKQAVELATIKLEWLSKECNSLFEQYMHECKARIKTAKNDRSNPKDS